ncbi:MAG: SOS response-associated peptidase [Bacteroidota bacterium]|nr:SOS response-associated peptidase [Bacteroidota bacterium]
MITLNAVCEELLFPGKIYREAALNRRCLILSSGFFEWRHVHPLNIRTGQPVKKAVTYPYYISLKDKPYFYMAGIWQPWTDKETGEYIESSAIITTKANKLLEQIHNTKKRMPTILNEDLAYKWLFGKLSEERILQIAATQYLSEEMHACSIAKDFREALEPTKVFAYEDLPALELAL